MMATTSDDKPGARKQRKGREGKPDLFALLREWLESEEGDEDEAVVTLPGTTGSRYPDELPPGLVIKIVKARGELQDKERELLRAKLREAGRMDDLG
jgi:hypothetical protein